jgi:hypothetical protein
MPLRHIGRLARRDAPRAAAEFPSVLGFALIGPAAAIAGLRTDLLVFAVIRRHTFDARSLLPGIGFVGRPIALDASSTRGRAS